MTASAIPIENIYYLLCYAWDRLEEAGLTAVQLTPETRLPELFARVLQSGVTHLLKRGLDRVYVTVDDEIPGVRGRLDIATSVKRASFPRTRAWCAVDELSSDVLHNRIIKTTLRALADVSGLEPHLAESLRDLYRRMPGVREIRVTDQIFRRVVLGRNTAYYGFLLGVCEIVHRNLLVDERSGEVTFRDFTRDDAQMARLFERFLFRFYEREQIVYAVAAPRLRWRAVGEAAALAYLPQMRTDIVLRSAERTIVVDAKYYGDALTENFDKASVRSEHLYQLLTYLGYVSVDSEPGRVTGALIYPRATQALCIRIHLCDHPLIITTIDLAQPWTGIRRDLLDLLRPVANHPRATGQTSAGVTSPE